MYSQYFRVRTEEHVTMSYVKFTVNLQINSLHTFNMQDKNSDLFCMNNPIFTEVSYDFSLIPQALMKRTMTYNT